MDATSTMRIVILGKTGTGKSSVAKTIFGEEVFKIDHTSNSGTSRCQSKTKSVKSDQISITLIDTPGFFDTSRPEEELKPEIVRCITECAPGPHAFVIVFKVEKFTELEQAVVTAIKSYFSEEVFKYATVLFTHGDDLPEGQTIEDFVHKNKSMDDLVKKCGGRCHVIDNKYWKNEQQDEYRSNRFQVDQLLNTIEKTWLANNGRFYTNENLQAVEKQIQQEQERIRATSPNMSEEETRGQAKVSVFEKLRIKLAGFGTGALLGALCGTVVIVAAIAAIGGFGAIAAMVTMAGLKPVLIGMGTVTAAVAGTGAVIGGVAGYNAAEGAKTPGEAAKRAKEAVKDGVKSTYDEIKVFCKSAPEQKFKPE